MFLEEIYIEEDQQRHFFYGPFEGEQAIEDFKLFLKKRLADFWKDSGQGDVPEDVQNLIKFIHLAALPGADWKSLPFVDDVLMWFSPEDFEQIQPPEGLYVEIVIVQNPSSGFNEVEMFAGPFLSFEDREEYMSHARAQLDVRGLNPHASKYIPCDNPPHGRKFEKMSIVGELVEGMESNPFLYVRSFSRTSPKKE